MQETNEHKRKLVVDLTIDLTNDDEVVLLQSDGKRVTISNAEDEEEEELCDGCEGPVDPDCGSFCRRCYDYTGHHDDEEEEGNCCGICGSEYETREDTADVCLDCYESERNICHRCKEVKTDSELTDEAGEYCEGFCDKCYPYVLDILSPVVELLKK